MDIKELELTNKQDMERYDASRKVYCEHMSNGRLELGLRRFEIGPVFVVACADCAKEIQPEPQAV